MIENSTYLDKKTNIQVKTMDAHVNHNQSLLGRDLDGTVPVYNTCSAPGSFSLTFDDGPTQLSSELDTTLSGANVRASFFINGNNFACIYDFADLLLSRFNQGHLIASHTWSHVHLNEGTYEGISRQLELIETAMIKILGVKPLYFRPPFGLSRILNPGMLPEFNPSKGIGVLTFFQSSVRNTSNFPSAKNWNNQANTMISCYRFCEKEVTRD
ncbi:hypothetical protein PCANC_19288 [Puccinia coronata f. sp. avenae]|uniref:NodB homology domain-containing protein n=1 Tax=Puccinia coronata f. sp. avenae TaxID=200324 RepID=A0A2N5S4F0_9BASI|nr:hypothetical protein PCANC_22466 [Puccinia coronata f. sp. avenae]PLW35182.1 hypothetical protein PCANC_19288 [Puccinia coronata f. sp. avenae]